MNRLCFFIQRLCHHTSEEIFQLSERTLSVLIFKLVIHRRFCSE